MKKMWQVGLAFVLGLLLGTAPFVDAQITAGTVRIRTSSDQSIVLGQGTMAASLPVAIASNQSAVPVNLNQYGGTSTTLGQKAMTASIPVVLSSDQSAVSTVPGALTSIVTGQQADTATAVALPTNTAKRVCFKVLAAGTQTVYFGPTGVTIATGQELQAGDSWCGTLDNSNRVFVIAASTGSTVAFDVLN